MLYNGGMQRLFRQILTPAALVIGLVLACVLFAILLAGIYLMRPAITPQIDTTAVVNVIAAPSATLPVPTLPPTPTATPTQPASGVPVPGLTPLAVGNYVQVGGTGVDGLRVRSDPGLSAKTLYVAIDSEVFKIIDGPREADGYTWWYLEEPFKQTVKGWAVANYLAPAQNP